MFPLSAICQQRLYPSLVRQERPGNVPDLLMRPHFTLKNTAFLRENQQFYHTTDLALRVVDYPILEMDKVLVVQACTTVCNGVQQVKKGGRLMPRAL